VHHLAAAPADGAGGLRGFTMPRLPDLPKRALTPEEREHLAERQRIQDEGVAARQARAAEREAAQAAAAAKAAAAHKFADAVEARRLQAQAEGRARVLPMD
jgi:hypothetical protein